MANRRNITVKVFRFNPLRDSNPTYKLYEVPLTGRMSVLGVLNFIYEELDSTLSFYYSCKYGRCGGCFVLVNGKPVMMCLTEALEDMTIDPLPRKKIVKDLLVDL
jgi:fumarate reductase iron-sulfur subunit